MSASRKPVLQGSFDRHLQLELRGAKGVRHARHVISQMAKVAVPRKLFQGMRRFALTLALLCFAFAAPLQAQQFRAAWADVFHNGLRSTNEVDTMISCLVTGRYNAVIAQVLAYMDTNATSLYHGAYWTSSIIPWCGYMTNGYDPLGYLCKKAHATNIQVYAWLGGSAAGIYRVSTAWPPPGNPTLATNWSWMSVPQANSQGGTVVGYVDGSTTYYMLDMGSPDAQEYIVSIVRELVTDYPIDGITWDDEHNATEYTLGIGFPANSTNNYPRSGLARYWAIHGPTNTPSATDTNYGNYRRRFKNELMARCQAEIPVHQNQYQPGAAHLGDDGLRRRPRHLRLHLNQRLALLLGLGDDVEERLAGCGHSDELQNRDQQRHRH